MSGSIVDDPTPAQDSAEDAVSLQQVADMLFLVFEAVKDLEAQFKQFQKDFGYSDVEES